MRGTPVRVLRDRGSAKANQLGKIVSCPSNPNAVEHPNDQFHIELENGDRIVVQRDEIE
jgi:hypothetical protein